MLKTITSDLKAELEIALTKQESADQLMQYLNRIAQLERQLAALTAKLDNDTGVSDVNYQSTVDAVK
jgi:hypothetical protein